MLPIEKNVTGELEELHTVQQVLARLTSAVPVGVVQVDAGRAIVHQNARAAEILDRPHATDLGVLFGGVVAADHGPLEAALSAVLLRGEDGELEISANRRDGRPVRCRLKLRVLSGDGVVTGAIVCIDDISEGNSTDGIRRSRQAEFRATYDVVTGCLDRRSALMALERALTDAQALGGGVAVVLVGVDGVAAVRHMIGRGAGDTLLHQVASQLKDVSRSGDVVGRVGEEELVVIGRGVHTPSQAVVIGDRVAAALRRKIAKQPTRHAVASIGVAWVSGSATVSADVLVAEAGLAMRASQCEGHGRPVLHAAS